MIYQKKSVSEYSRSIKFKSISHHKNNKNVDNNWAIYNRIGSLDLETYQEGNVSKVYALGFYTNIDETPSIYYIDKDNLSSDILVQKCINEMLKPKYTDYTFYSHNLNKYDAPFILKSLYNYNKIDSDNPFVFNIIWRDNNIIKLVKKKFDNRYRKVTIKDSILILPCGLRELGLSF